MNSPSSGFTTLQPMRTWRFRLCALYWVAMKILRRPGVDAVGEREVDDAVGAAEGHRGLGAVARERVQPLARPARQQHRHHVPQQEDVHAHPGRPGHSRGRSTTRAGDAVAAGDAQRQAGHVVLARLDLREVEPLDDHDARLQQRVVGGEVAAAELLDREVVEAHELDAGLRQVGRGVRRQVDVVLLERLAAAAGRSCASSAARAGRRAGRAPPGPRGRRARGRPGPPRGPCPSGSRAAARPRSPRPPGSGTARPRGCPVCVPRVSCATL